LAAAVASRRLVKSIDTVSFRRGLRNMTGRAAQGPPPGESRFWMNQHAKDIEHMPNVLEAYPDIRFITELRL